MRMRYPSGMAIGVLAVFVVFAQAPPETRRTSMGRSCASDSYSGAESVR